MSDIKSMLPVRSAQDPDQRVQVKVVDSLNPTQQVQVDVARNLHVKVHATDAGGTDRILRSSEEGNIVIDGEYDGTNNSTPSSAGLIAAERSAAPGMADMVKRVTAISSGTTHALDISLHDESGDAYTYDNPLSVTLVESPGEEVQDYSESANDVAVGATEVHEYIVPAGKVLKLDQVLASGSGRLKVLIEQSQDGSIFLKIATRFNSTAEPNCDTDLRRIVSVPAGGKIRVTITNLDEDPFTTYSTVVGLLL